MSLPAVNTPEPPVTMRQRIFGLFCALSIASLISRYMSWVIAFFFSGRRSLITRAAASSVTMRCPVMKTVPGTGGDGAAGESSGCILHDPPRGPNVPAGFPRDRQEDGNAVDRYSPPDRDFGEAAGESGLLYRPARHAAGEENRQSGRRQRLPSVLRRRQSQPRHRSHLLRFSGRARAARNQLDLAHRSAGRRRKDPRLLARSPEAGRRRDRRSDRGRRPADAAVRGWRGPAAGAVRRRRSGTFLAMG